VPLFSRPEQKTRYGIALTTALKVSTRTPPTSFCHNGFLELVLSPFNAPSATLPRLFSKFHFGRAEEQSFFSPSRPPPLTGFLVLKILVAPKGKICCGGLDALRAAIMGHAPKASMHKKCPVPGTSVKNQYSAVGVPRPRFPLAKSRKTKTQSVQRPPPARFFFFLWLSSSRENRPARIIPVAGSGVPPTISRT